MIARKFKQFYLIVIIIAAPLLAQSVTVEMGNVTVDGYTSDIEVPVLLTNPNDSVGGIQFDLEVVPGMVSLFNVDAVGAASGFTGDFNLISSNIYRVVLFNSTGSTAIPANADTVMTLHFDGSSVLSAQLDLLIAGLIVSAADGNTILSNGNNGSITIGQVVSLNLTDGTGDINETVSVTVDMDNGGIVGGVQLDILETPDYLTITDVTTTGRTAGFTISTTAVGTGIRVLLYDDNGGNIGAGTGPILNVDYSIHSNAYAGNVATFFENVVISDSLGGIYWISMLDSGSVTVFPGYMEEPHNLVATSGLDGMVPLAWDAPYGPVGQDVTVDYEDGAFPIDWSITTNSAVGWFVTQEGSSTYWTIPGHTWYACSNDDAANDDGSVDYMVTPPLNTNGATDFQLSFSSFYDGSYGQTAHVEVSTDGVNFVEVYTLPANIEWVTEVVDLNNYVNENELYIAFHSNDNGAWASGWAVDDILISFAGARMTQNIHYDFNELGQWVITAEKEEVVARYPEGITYQQKVDWNHPLEPQNIDRDVPVSGYNIYRTIDGVNIDLLATVGADQLTYTDDSVLNGTTYSYYVTADYSPDGTESGPSNIEQATPVEWIEVSISSGAALSGTTDTLDIFIHNESNVSFFYFEVEDNPDLIVAQEILATDRTSGWSLDVSEVGGQMVVTGLGLSNNISPGSDAVCRIVVLASSLDPILCDLNFTTASVLDANGNNMIWTADASTFDVTVETQTLVMPNAHANPGEMATIPLILNNTQDVYGIQIFLTSEPVGISGIAVGTTLYHDFSNWTVEGNNVNGQYRILLFNTSLDNPISPGTGHIADISMFADATMTAGTTVQLMMQDVIVVDQNNIPMHTELFESTFYVGTPEAIYSVGEVDPLARTITIDLENTSPVYVTELTLTDAPQGIQITNVSPAGRFAGSVDGQSGEAEDGTGYILAYDLANGISIGSGPILEISYEAQEGSGFTGDVISWLSSINSADASLNAIPSSGSGFAILDVNLRVDQNATVTPTIFSLHPAYPNPFNPTTTIQYDLPYSSDVDLRIYDLAGREIRMLVKGFENSGVKTAVWDGRDNGGRNVSAGIYIYQLRASNQVQSHKMILLK